MVSDWLIGRGRRRNGVNFECGIKDCEGFGSLGNAIHNLDVWEDLGGILDITGPFFRIIIWMSNWLGLCRVGGKLDHIPNAANGSTWIRLPHEYGSNSIKFSTHPWSKTKHSKGQNLESYSNYLENCRTHEQDKISSEWMTDNTRYGFWVFESTCVS